jgi:hypothetical protein
MGKSTLLLKVIINKKGTGYLPSLPTCGSGNIPMSNIFIFIKNILVKFEYGR